MSFPTIACLFHFLLSQCLPLTVPQSEFNLLIKIERKRVTQRCIYFRNITILWFPLPNLSLSVFFFLHSFYICN